MAIDPSTPATLYAGTQGLGVFKSMNGGTSWTAVNSGLTYLNINALAIDPSTPATLYAGTGFGVFKSTNGGASWTEVNSGLMTTTVQTLTIDPSTPATLYAGTYYGGVFKSVNGGASWTAVNSGLSGWALDVSALAIDPSTPATLHAGIGAGVAKSTNGGTSWTWIFLGSGGYALAIDPSTPATLYVGGSGGVFKSTDGGGSWTAVNSGLTNTFVFALAIDPSLPATLYAGTDGGVFRSTNGGTSWTAINSGLATTRVYALAINSSTPATLYAGNLGGVFKSTTGGSSWIDASSGLTGAYIQALAIDPSTPATLYAGTLYGGVSKSTDGGASWAAVNSGLANASVYAMAIDPSAPATLYAGTGSGGVFKSTNGGTSWTAINNGLTTPLRVCYSLAIDPVTPSTLYAGGAGVFKSTNGGTSWTAVNSGITAFWVHALAIDPSTPTTLYAGTDGGGVFKSTNGGTSWIAVSNGSYPGLPFGLHSSKVYALAIDPASPATVYAGAADPSGTSTRGLFKSTNGGTIWSRTGSGLTTADVQDLAIDPSTPSTLYAGTGTSVGRVFKSTNGGTNWTTINSGLMTTTVQTLTIDPFTPATLYAGTSGGGLFKSLNGGTTWQPTGAAAAEPTSGMPAPTPSSPAGSGTSTSPTFTWSAVSGATSYRLMVATTAGALPTDPASSSCSGCAINTTTPTNYYIPSTPLSAATTYFWQVQGRSATQNGTWSTRPSFTTAGVGAVTIIGVSPSPVVASGAVQTLRVFGSAFQPGMTATLVDTTNGGAPSVKATSSLTSTQASISATFPAVASTWTVMVTNPGGSTSGVRSFRVIPPAATGGDLQASRLAIDPIGLIQTVGSAFAITVRAVDANGSVLPIDADIQLRTRAVAVNPSILRLISGVASAQVKIDSPLCGAELEAAGAGATGTSNAFSVQGAGQGSLAGNVVNENGQPLSGVVTLTGCAGSIDVSAGPSGKYISPQIAAGTYKAYATFNSVTSKIVTVTVMANSCTRLNDLVISTCNPGGLTPILFLPGIMGSTTGTGLLPSLPAYSPSQELGPPYTPSDDWVAGPTLHLNGLYFSALADATRWDHLVTAIGIRNGAYVTFIPQLGYVPRPCMIIPVPYDWRMRPDDAARKYLIPRIKAAKAQAGVSKVHIVAHSMGGLVARSYIQSEEYAFDVDRLAMVGTPNAGAEIAYLMAEGGNPLRADQVAITNAAPLFGIGVNVYTRVAEGMYKTLGRDLDSILPVACSSWAVSSGECEPLKLKPEDPEWFRYRQAMRKFFASRVPSMHALLPVNRAFLQEGSLAPRTIECPEYQNQFLSNLNAPAPGSHIDRIGGASATGNVVKARVFAGIQKNTVDRFTIKSRPSNCLADTLSPDGEYLGFTPTNDGDGTVRRESVSASFTDLAPHDEGKHADLLTVYKSGIADFLFGISSSSRSANEPEEATAERIGVMASVAAPNVELRVSGRARPYLFNGSGEGCGLNPGTSELVQTLPGCSSIDARPQESLLGLTGISNGVYTLAVTSAWPEESVLSSTLDDGSHLSEASATFFFKPETRNLTLTVAAGTTTPIRIDGSVGPATSLLADATEVPRTATLSWTASGDPNVIGYDVYSKRDDEPKLALLAQMAATLYETSDAWSDAAGIPLRHYAVAARVASGQTSVLTEFAANDDRDHDGLTDVEESRYQTDPGNPDTDGDALKDGDEITTGSDPLNPDTDGDGFPDGLEVSRGSDPLSPGSTPVALQPPGNVVATATSASQVQVSWSAVTGAVSYQVFRSSNHGAYLPIGTPTVNGFSDSGLAASTTYLYTVQAIDSTAGVSPSSSADLATTIMFTDAPLVAGSTLIKAAHWIELRTAVNAARAAAGLTASVFSSDMAQGLPIRASHVNELRSSLDAARTALGLSLLAYPDPELEVGSTRVRAVHVSSVRDGVK